MWVLQILAPPSLRLGLLESPKKIPIPTLSISNKNVEIWMNVIPTHSIGIIHYIHQQKK